MGLFEKLKKMRILLIDDDEWIRDSMSLFFESEVDDDEWIRDSMSLFFESEGCSLLALETAEEGLEELKRQPYDIIIVDYRLPGMDGLEFLKRIKEPHNDALKILITAYGSKDVFMKAGEIGINDFIDKPFTIETIEDVLFHLIENRNQKD
jgi:DNA-binding NtrC family response regulator